MNEMNKNYDIIDVVLIAAISVLVIDIIMRVI